jgi:A/G-specific adenine glycosylase
VVIERYGGRVPSDVDELAALPGIGRYTAGAIASIAFGRRAAVLEANTRRVLIRLVALNGDCNSAAGQSQLWSLAERLLPRTKCGTFNQAMMDLGAELCVPLKPACELCPVREFCAAHAAGLQNVLPKRRRKPLAEAIREAAVVVRRGKKVLLVRRPQGERWAGMWDFLRLPLPAEEATVVGRTLSRGAAELAGVRIRPGEVIGEIRHGVTRFRITLVCFKAAYLGEADGTAHRGLERRWVSPAEFAAYPLPTPSRRLSRLVVECTVNGR